MTGKVDKLGNPLSEDYVAGYQEGHGDGWDEGHDAGYAEGVAKERARWEARLKEELAAQEARWEARLEEERDRWHNAGYLQHELEMVAVVTASDNKYTATERRGIKKAMQDAVRAVNERRLGREDQS